MKKIYLLMLTISIFSKIVAKEVKVKDTIKKYDNIFNQIKSQRVVMTDIELDKVATPFIKKRELKVIKGEKNIKKIKIKPLVLRLHGIFDNRVRINNKWYKLGSKVHEYKLIKIRKNSVILKRHKKKIKLFLRKKNDKIKITKNL